MSAFGVSISSSPASTFDSFASAIVVVELACITYSVHVCRCTIVLLHTTESSWSSRVDRFLYRRICGIWVVFRTGTRFEVLEGIIQHMGTRDAIDSRRLVSSTPHFEHVGEIDYDPSWK